MRCVLHRAVKLPGSVPLLTVRGNPTQRLPSWPGASLLVAAPGVAGAGAQDNAVTGMEDDAPPVKETRRPLQTPGQALWAVRAATRWLPPGDLPSIIAACGATCRQWAEVADASSLTWTGVSGLLRRANPRALAALAHQRKATIQNQELESARISIGSGAHHRTGSGDLAPSASLRQIPRGETSAKARGHQDQNQCRPSLNQGGARGTRRCQSPGRTAHP